MASNNVGEYGTHIILDDDDDKPILSSIMRTNQRPLATSRLTPAPARKQRPVANFNYNILLEEDSDESSAESSPTTQAISIHFNEEELKEEAEPFLDLPLNVQNALIISLSLGGASMAVFLVILVLFKIMHKSRVRLRNPAALFANSKSHLKDMAGSGDCSEATSPETQPKRGYAKLPQRSKSLWGTLRRSMRQLENVNC